MVKREFFWLNNININEIKQFSKILSDWIKYKTKEDNLLVNEKCLYWESCWIIEAYNNRDFFRKVFFTEPYKDFRAIYLATNINAFRNTGYFKPAPKPRYFVSLSFARNLLNTISVTYEIFILLFKKRDVVLSKNLAVFLKKKYINLKGKIIFSKFLFFIQRRKARKDLSIFLERYNTKYDIDTLVLLFPDYLVELLPFYFKISKNLKVNKIHGWVHDIYKSPLLLIKCLISNSTKIIGYQHGGSNGFYKDISYICEYNFYSKFIYWGFSNNDISPFKFGSKSFKDIYFYEYKFNKKENMAINIITDRQDSAYAEINENFNGMIAGLLLNKFSINVHLHPYDSEKTIKTFLPFSDQINIKVGADQTNIDDFAINVVSIYSTLFWEFIYKRNLMICYFPDFLIPEITHNHEMINLLQRNNLLFSSTEIIERIDSNFINQNFINNQKFFLDLRNLVNNQK